MPYLRVSHTSVAWGRVELRNVDLVLPERVVADANPMQLRLSQ